MLFDTTTTTTTTITELENTNINPFIHIPCDFLTTTELQELSKHCGSKENAVFFMHGDKIQFLTLVDRVAAKDVYKL